VFTVNGVSLGLRTYCHYWGRSLVLVLGIAVTTAIISGALGVGESITGTLRQQVSQRLGSVTHTWYGGNHVISSGVTKSVREEHGVAITDLLMVNGKVSRPDGGAMGCSVFGIDAAFGRFGFLAGAHELVVARWKWQPPPVETD